MSLSRPLLATFLLLSLAVQLAHSLPLLDTVTAPTIDCGSACDVRCSMSWRQKMCKKLCNICCGKCNCVPPGTSVEVRALCPCYANMKNPKGKSKCP